VIVGDATRFLHKVSGTFDLVFQDSDTQLYSPMHDRIVTLLRPGGVLVTNRTLWSGDEYSTRLAADPRLYTTLLQAGGGVSVSVKVNA
jgi:predicted O-methyltransferase YrrM